MWLHECISINQLCSYMRQRSVGAQGLRLSRQLVVRQYVRHHTTGGLEGALLCYTLPACSPAQHQIEKTKPHLPSMCMRAQACDTNYKDAMHIVVA